MQRGAALRQGELPGADLLRGGGVAATDRGAGGSKTAAAASSNGLTGAAACDHAVQLRRGAASDGLVGISPRGGRAGTTSPEAGLERKAPMPKKSKSPTRAWHQKQAEIQALQWRSHSMQSELRRASGRATVAGPRLDGIGGLQSGDGVEIWSTGSTSGDRGFPCDAGSPMSGGAFARGTPGAANAGDAWPWPATLDEPATVPTSFAAASADASTAEPRGRTAAWWASADLGEAPHGQSASLEFRHRPKAGNSRVQRPLMESSPATLAGVGTVGYSASRGGHPVWEPEPYRPETSTNSDSEGTADPRERRGRGSSGQRRDAWGSGRTGVATEGDNPCLDNRSASQHRAAELWIQEYAAQSQQPNAQLQRSAELECLHSELAAEQERRRRERFDWQRRLHRIEEAQVRTAAQVDQLAQEVVEGRQSSTGASSVGELAEELVRAQAELDRARAAEAKERALIDNMECRGAPSRAGEASASEAWRSSPSSSPSASGDQLQHLREEVDLMRAAEQWYRLQTGDELCELRAARERMQEQLHLRGAELDEYKAKASVETQKALSAEKAAVSERRPLENEVREAREQLSIFREQTEALRVIEQRRLAQQGDELEGLRLSERRVRAEFDVEVGELLQQMQRQRADALRAETTAQEVLKSRLKSLARTHNAEMTAARTSWEKHCIDEVQAARCGIESVMAAQHAEVSGRLRQELDEQDQLLASFMDMRTAARGEAAESRELLKQLRRFDADVAELKEQLSQVEAHRRRACVELEEERVRSDARLRLSRSQQDDHQSEVFNLRSELQVEFRWSEQQRQRLEQAQSEYRAALVERADLEQSLSASKQSLKEVAAERRHVAQEQLQLRLAEVEELSHRRESCLGAELDMLHVENKALQMEAAQRIRVAVHAEEEGETWSRAEEELRRRHASEAAELLREARAFETELAKETEQLECTRTLREKEKENAREAREAQKQVASEATSLRAQLTDAARRHNERLGAERRVAEKSEELLLRKVYWLEEAECNADKVLQDQLSEDMEIMGDLRRRSDELWTQLEASQEVLGSLYTLCKEEVQDLPADLSHEVVGELTAAEEAICAARLLKLPGAPSSADGSAFADVGAVLESAAAARGGDLAALDGALVRRSAWCASAFLAVLSAARSSAKGMGTVLAAPSSSSSFSAFLDTPPRVSGQGADASVSAAAELKDEDDVSDAAEEAARPSAHDSQPEQPCRQQDLHQRRRERERLRSNAQLEEKIRLLQASFDSPTAPDAGGDDRRDLPEAAGTRPVRLPTEEPPRPQSADVGCQAQSSSIEPRLFLVARRLAQLAESECNDGSAVGDLPQLADRVGARLAECEARCLNLQKEVQAEKRLRHQAEGRFSQDGRDKPRTGADKDCRTGSHGPEDAANVEEQARLSVIAAGAAEAERQAHYLVVQAETFAAEAEDRLRASEEESVKRRDALESTEARLEKAEAMLAARGAPAGIPPAAAAAAAATLQDTSAAAPIDVMGLWAELEEKQRELRQLTEASSPERAVHGSSSGSDRAADGVGREACAGAAKSTPAAVAYPESPPPKQPTASGPWLWEDGCTGNRARADEARGRAGGAYPRSPSPEGVPERPSAAYPVSPPRSSAGNQPDVETQAAAASTHSGGSRSRSSSNQGRKKRLSSLERQRSQSDETAAEVFSRAEALSEVGKFREAAPLYHRVLVALQSSADSRFSSVEAEVWAHLGVAMQSLDDIEQAIESYQNAVRLDPSLHVCFANLATLYLYLEDVERARESIKQALLLDPRNATYLDIQQSMAK